MPAIIGFCFTPAPAKSRKGCKLDCSCASFMHNSSTTEAMKRCIGHDLWKVSSPLTVRGSSSIKAAGLRTKFLAVRNARTRLSHVLHKSAYIHLNPLKQYFSCSAPKKIKRVGLSEPDTGGASRSPQLQSAVCDLRSPSQRGNPAPEPCGKLAASSKWTSWRRDVLGLGFRGINTAETMNQQR